MTDVTIRYAFPDDDTAVARLAALDSSSRPPGSLLVVEVAGELWAAVSLQTGEAVADPFRHTADLIVLLRRRAAQLSGEEERSSRRLRRFAARFAEL